VRLTLLVPELIWPEPNDQLTLGKLSAPGFEWLAARATLERQPKQAFENVLARQFGVDAALTGPFVRGDVGTVRGHLETLRNSAPEALDLYVAVARRELDIARRRGRLDDDAAAQLDALLNDADRPR